MRWEKGGFEGHVVATLDSRSIGAYLPILAEKQMARVSQPFLPHRKENLFDREGAVVRGVGPCLPKEDQEDEALSSKGLQLFQASNVARQWATGYANQCGCSTEQATKHG